MSRWECIVCGLVYDEKEGWPDDGIAPGTKWEDVPEDWLCPDCGVGKEDFELLEEETLDDTDPAEDPQADAEHPAVVILGTGLAGYGLAKEFRKHDTDTPLLLITSDDGRAYSKPMLSTGYTKGTEADDLAQNDADGMAQQLHASVKTMTRVTSIDTANQTIALSDASSLSYAKLVLAVGAEVIKPPIEGDALDSVYSINDLADFATFRDAVRDRGAKKVCVIGAGLIGCEYTNDLINGGFEVEVVDPLAHCLPTLLPEPAGRAVQRALEEKGARFHFGPLVTRVDQADGGVSVTLNSGASIEADIVVSAVGVRPSLGLAQSAGLDVNRGIVTNRLLETSASNVYAMGDCAEVSGNVLVYVAPLMAAAKALGKTLAGDATQVSYPAMPVTIKTPACPVVVAPPAADAQGDWQVEEDGNNVKALFRDATGNLLGFALTGEATKEKIALQKELPPILA